MPVLPAGQRHGTADHRAADAEASAEADLGHNTVPLLPTGQLRGMVDQEKQHLSLSQQGCVGVFDGTSGPTRGGHPRLDFAGGLGGCSKSGSGPLGDGAKWADVSEEEGSTSGSDSPGIEGLPHSKPGALVLGNPHLGHEARAQDAEDVLAGALAKCDAWEAKVREELLQLTGHPDFLDQDIGRCSDLVGAIQSVLAEKARIRDDLASVHQGSLRPCAV